jgi:hypothetical protein
MYAIALSIPRQPLMLDELKHGWVDIHSKPGITGSFLT